MLAKPLEATHRFFSSPRFFRQSNTALRSYLTERPILMTGMSVRRVSFRIFAVEQFKKAARLVAVSSVVVSGTYHLLDEKYLYALLIYRDR